MTSDQLKVIVETVQQLSLAQNLEKIMTVIRSAARKVTGADGATFVLKDRDLCFYADEDAIAPLWKGQRFPMSACISGWTMINKKTACIPDIYYDTRIPIDAYRPTFVKSLLMVPIRTSDPIGAIGNYWAKQHSPSADEIQILQAMADITSVSIENVYAYNKLKSQNEKLYEIAFLQSHQVRVPVANIQGLYSLFNFKNHADPVNVEIFEKLKTAADNLDSIIHEIVQKTHKLKSDI